MFDPSSTVRAWAREISLYFAESRSTARKCSATFWLEFALNTYLRLVRGADGGILQPCELPRSESLVGAGQRDLSGRLGCGGRTPHLGNYSYWLNDFKPLRLPPIELRRGRGLLWLPATPGGKSLHCKVKLDLEVPVRTMGRGRKAPRIPIFGKKTMAISCQPMRPISQL